MLQFGSNQEMGLRDIGATLPPGFRFYPSDEELVCHYLHKKIANEDVLKGTLVEIDLHTCEPWQLPEMAKLNSSEWYFFSFRDRKYATGYRTNRATIAGYWKATGKDKTVVDSRTSDIVGMRKTLVFYMNRAPNGIKTGWIMHEFRLENPNTPPKEDWVLCRVFYKAKGDNSNQPCLQDKNHKTTYNVTPNVDPSPNLTSFCQPPPCVHRHHPFTTTVSDHSLPLHIHHHQNCFGNHQNMVQHPPNSTLIEPADQKIITTNNMSEDDQFGGFFYDMGFEDHIHDTEYEIDNDNDNDNDKGIVFYEESLISNVK